MSFAGNKLVFEGGYEFAKFSAVDDVVMASQIDEVCLGNFPCSLVVGEKEVIFVSKEYEEELRQFAVANGLSLSQRVDIWSLINEDFLVGDLDDDHRNEVLKILGRQGVDLDEALLLRARLADLMEDYNDLHLDDFDLSHYDLLLLNLPYSLLPFVI